MGVWERSPAGLAIALADPGLDAGQPGRAARPAPRGRDRLALLRARLRRRRALRRPVGLAAARAAARRARTGLILDYVPNHVAPDHPWLTERPDCFLAGTEEELARAPGRVTCDRRRDRRPRARPVLPAVARRRAAERVLAGAARRGRRDADRRRRAVRRAALRHGDADDQRGVRAHLGRARWPGAGGGLLADADRPRQGGASRTSCSSPRRTGTWSGRSSSRASTTATTSASTTGSCTSPPSRCAGTCRPTPATRSGLMRFIENHDEPRAAATFGPAQGARRRGRDVDAPGRAALPRRPARRPPHAHPGVPRAAGRTSRRTPTCARSTSACCARSPSPGCATATGACASPPAGRTTTRTAGSSPGAGRAALAPAGRGQPVGRARAGARATAVGRPRAAATWELTDRLSGAVVRARRRRARSEGLYVALDPWGSHFLAAIALSSAPAPADASQAAV